jgi:hypothetical protein
LYWSDLRDKVAGLALVQSPYGGSPIASDILREGQIADKEARRIMEFIVCKLIKVLSLFLFQFLSITDGKKNLHVSESSKRKVDMILD